MAVLALGLAGAAVGNSLITGTYLGLSGAAIGWMVGTSVGTMLMMPAAGSSNVQGPRLSDMRASAGGYGTGIVKTWGSPRVNGNVIWTTELIETATTQTADSGKKGGKGLKPSAGSNSLTTYSYSVSCAVGVCEGPIEGIRRIWANGKLIYDMSGSGPVTNDAIIPLAGMTIYTGTEEQTADPVMQAALGASNVPAYRGLAYVVFDNLQLADFGNRHPKFDFELGGYQTLYVGNDYYDSLTWSSPDLINWTRQGTPYEGVVFSNGVNQFVMFKEEDSQTFDEFGNPIVGTNYISRVSANGLTWTNGPSYETFFEYWPSYWDDLYNAFVHHNGTYMCLPYDFAVFDSVNKAAIITSTDGLHWSITGSMGASYTYLDKVTDVIFCTFLNRFVAIVYPDNDDNGCYTISAPAASPSNFTPLGTIAAARNRGDYSYNLCEFNNKLWTVVRKASPGNEFVIMSSTDGVTWTDAHTIPDNGPNNLDMYIGYVLSNGERLVLLYGGYPADYPLHPGFLRSQVTTDGVNWSSSYTISEYDVSFLSKPTWQGQYIIWTDIYDTPEQNRILWSADGQTWNMTQPDFAIDGIRSIASILYGSITTKPKPLSEVVSELCLSAGLSAGDIDVTAISSIIVPGYVRANPMSARSAIEPLLNAFNVDAYESDGKITFIPKLGGYIGPVITEADLGASTRIDEVVDTVKIVRAQEVDIPNEIVVRHIDRSLDYDINQQYARRLSSASDGSLTVDLPVVMSANEAISLAQTLLYQAWAHRDQYYFSTTQKYSAYEPSDVLQVPFGGEYRQVRIVKKEEEGPLINWTATSEDLTIYSQNLSSSSGNSGSSVIVAEFADTDLMVFETPLLRDELDFLALTVVAGGTSDKPWPGGSLFVTAEKGEPTLVALGALPPRAVTGRLTTSLAAVTGPISAAFDTVNSFTVEIPWGTLESYTAEQVLIGYNTCVIQRSDHTVEVLGFQTATLVSPGVYTLSNLLRNIRQNRSYSGASAGAKFAMLQAGTSRLLPMQLPSLGNAFVFAGPRYGVPVDQAEEVAVVLTGMSKKPLSPITVAGSRDLADNLTITWTRRSRVGGSWPTGENGPIGEASEAYEIDIMDGATVVRTLFANEPTAEYSATDQVVDFGSPLPASVTINVYQISAYIGRGYPANATI